MLRQIQHGLHRAGVDTFEQDAGGRAIAVSDHHRIDDERRHAGDARHQLHLLHDLAVFAKIGGVFQHEHVRVDAEHLFAELRAKAASDTHDGRERAHAEGHAERREHRPNGDEGALLRAHVAQRQVERETHQAPL